MFRFAVVVFEGDNSIAYVSRRWITNNVCSWPPYKSPIRISKAIKEDEEPQETWQQFAVKVIYETDSFEKARAKAKRAEDTSDMATSSDGEKRRRIKKKRYSSDDSDVPPVQLYTPPPSFPSVGRSMNTYDNRAVYSPGLQLTPSRNEEIHGGETYFPPSYLSISQATSSRSENQNNTPCALASQAYSSRSENFEKKVLTLLEKLFADVQDLKRLQATNSNKMSVAAKLPEGCPALPLNNIEDLAHLEAFLKVEGHMNKMCSYLSTTGGYSVKDCTRRVLVRLVSNPLSKKYNWKGSRGDKLSFQDMINVCKMIYETVRCTPEFGSATDVEITDAIKKWLMHSADRDGGRSRREKKH